MELKDVFIAKARKYNHYEETEKVNPNHSCRNCIRKHFSYPYTCNDGWPIYHNDWQDRGATCLNWGNNPDIPVD